MIDAAPGVTGHVMRPLGDYDVVRCLVARGLNDCVVARQTGIPRTTIRGWRRNGCLRRTDLTCPVCGKCALSGGDYAYLLGLYLGDGHLVRQRRDVYKLRVTLDARYRGIVDECAAAIGVVSAGRRVGRQAGRGCVIVGAHWKHWPCVFPQHGPGRKHSRSIHLVAWQRRIARQYPGRLLRGLIHSDGCRFLNQVKGRAYPRYQFTNHSPDILRIFCETCESLQVSWTQPRWKQVSVARADSVAKLDLVVGPKR